MTKKDFEFIARILFEAKPIASQESERGRQWTKTVNAFSEALAQENPRFNLGKFERACETGEGIRAKAA
jgi:hypothetical protein